VCVYERERWTLPLFLSPSLSLFLSGSCLRRRQALYRVASPTALVHLENRRSLRPKILSFSAGMAGMALPRKRDGEALTNISPLLCLWSCSFLKCMCIRRMNPRTVGNTRGCGDLYADASLCVWPVNYVGYKLAPNKINWSQRGPHFDTLPHSMRPTFYFELILLSVVRDTAVSQDPKHYTCSLLATQPLG
jgi:hypothetical protein